MAIAPSLQGLVRQTGSTHVGRRQGRPFDPTTGDGTMLVDTLNGQAPSEVDATNDPAGYSALLHDRARNRFWSAPPGTNRGMGPGSDQWAPYWEAYDVLGENTGKRATADTRSLDLPIDNPPSNDPAWWTGRQGMAPSVGDEARDEAMMPQSLRRLYRSQFITSQRGGR